MRRRLKQFKELIKQFVSLDAFETSMEINISDNEATSKDQPVATRLVALATKDVAIEDVSNEFLSAE